MPSSSTWAGQWWAEAEGRCCGWTEQWPRAATGHGVDGKRCSLGRTVKEEQSRGWSMAGT